MSFTVWGNAALGGGFRPAGDAPSSPEGTQEVIFDQFGNEIPLPPLLVPATRGNYNRFSNHALLGYPDPDLGASHPDVDLASFISSDASESVRAISRHSDLQAITGGVGNNHTSSSDTFVVCYPAPSADTTGNRRSQEVYDTGPFGLAGSIGGTFSETTGSNEQYFIDWRTDPDRTDDSRGSTHYNCCAVNFSSGFTMAGSGIKGFEHWFAGNPTFTRWQTGGWSLTQTPPYRWQGRDATNPNGDTGDVPSVSTLPSNVSIFTDCNDGTWWLLVDMYQYSDTTADGTGGARTWLCEVNQSTGEVLNGNLVLDITSAGSARGMCTESDYLNFARSQTGATTDRLVAISWFGNSVGGDPYTNKGPFKSACFRWWTGPNVDMSISALSGSDLGTLS